MVGFLSPFLTDFTIFLCPFGAVAPVLRHPWEVGGVRSADAETWRNAMRFYGATPLTSSVLCTWWSCYLLSCPSASCLPLYLIRSVREIGSLCVSASDVPRSEQRWGNEGRGGRGEIYINVYIYISLYL